jgi:hypothetical protein
MAGQFFDVPKYQPRLYLRYVQIQTLIGVENKYKYGMTGYFCIISFSKPESILKACFCLGRGGILWFLEFPDLLFN